jgi:quercetin dioxygenase-like cupin family protein
MKAFNYRQVTPTEEAPGVAMHTVISARDGAPRFAMRVFAIQPDASTPFHSHWWEHEVYVVSGQGVVRTEQGDRPLASEDVVYVSPEEKHCFVNTGAEPLRFVCVIPNLESHQ